MVDRYGDQSPRPPATPPATGPYETRETYVESTTMRDQSQGQDTMDQAKQKSQQAMDQAKQKGQQAMDQAKQKGQQAAHMAEQRADQGADRVADVAERAADTLRERSSQIPGGQRTTQMANQAASTLEQGAEYLRSTDPNEWRMDLENMIRSHPTQSLAAGLAIGFLLARAVR